MKMTTKHQTRPPIKQRAQYDRDASFGDKHPMSSVAFFHPIDPTQAEREAQRQEFLRKEKRESENFKDKQFSKNHPQNPRPKQKQPLLSKTYSLEENLERTWAWLAKTFPHLFNEVKPLDIHILRDIKAHYKAYQVKRNYPPDLAIKAALYRYMEKPEYLLCLQEEAIRYNAEGNSLQKVTKEEQEEAIKKLKEMGILEHPIDLEN